MNISFVDEVMRNAPADPGVLEVWLGPGMMILGGLVLVLGLIFFLMPSPSEKVRRAERENAMAGVWVAPVFYSSYDSDGGRGDSGGWSGGWSDGGGDGGGFGGGGGGE